MTWTAGDILSIATGGWYKQATGTTPPAAPTLDAVTAASATTATATVTHAAAVTVRLYYRRAGDATLTAGASRTGSGAITQTGLTTGAAYVFVAVAESDGLYSLPSVSRALDLTATVPTGEFAAPLYYLRKTLSESPAFIALTEEDDAAAALRHIHYFGVDAPGVWAAETTYALGATLRIDGGKTFIAECTTAGASGETVPTWPTTAAATVEDGTAVWTIRAAYGSPLMGAVRAARPFAIVGIGDEWSAELAAMGSANYLAIAGNLALVLEMDTAAADAATHAAAGTAWANTVGAILSDLRELAGQAGYLDIQSIDLVQCGRSMPDTRQNEGDRWLALFTIGYRSA